MAAMDKPTKELIQLLHNTDEAERRTVYLGIGYALANMPFISEALNRKNSDYRIRIAGIASEINELAVVDYDSLKRLILTMVDYKLACMSDNSKSVVSASNVGEVFNTSRYFSDTDLEAINQNLAIFKTSVLAFSKWYNSHDRD